MGNICDCDTKIEEAINIIKVNIRAKDHLWEDGYNGVDLMLPASKSELIDTLDRAKIPHGSGEYMLTPKYTTPHYLLAPLSSEDSLSLSEVNYLARRVDLLNEQEKHKLEGVIAQHPCDNVADLINAAHNLDKYSFYPGFTTDWQLGEHAISNEIFPEFADMSDTALDCLDRSKIGARLRREEGGIFTQVGYLVPEESNWDIVYDSALAERVITFDKRDPIISLEICKHEDDRERIWLHCPASQEEIEYVLESINAESFDDCIVRNVQSMIPALEYGISFDHDIDEVNALAADIKASCMDDLPKYKAAFELEDVTDLEHARELTKSLGGYEFDPIATAAEYGRMMLEKSGMDVDLAAEYGFDFDAYGRSQMTEQCSGFSSYGVLTPIQQQAPEVKLESTIEPTMGGM